jgi:hypothetical protein
MTTTMAAHAKGAAAAMRSHMSQCGLKGNRKPATKTTGGASTRVGGYAGAVFSNNLASR